MQLRGWGFTLFYDTMWKGVDKTTFFAWQSIYRQSLVKHQPINHRVAKN